MPFTILFSSVQGADAVTVQSLGERQRSVKPPAEGIFGAGDCLPARDLYGHADQIRKKRVIFDFQNRALPQNRRAEKLFVQKIRASEAGAYAAVQRDPDVSRLIDKGFSVIADNGSGPQAFSHEFAVEFRTERVSRFQKKTVFSAKQLLCLLCRHLYASFSLQITL